MEWGNENRRMRVIGGNPHYEDEESKWSTYIGVKTLVRCARVNCNLEVTESNKLIPLEHQFAERNLIDTKFIIIQFHECRV